ncbi:helix-turn-helix domain-containing protein [Nocardioides sp.]|uniref:helix-turn-helix domain-containing protein n=1 Tax=Nocardioides sp. TaxID=35761 RepID=UPI002608C87C|nr:XRE family transcriptional regulator [Nocardioides sp.]
MVDPAAPEGRAALDDSVARLGGRIRELRHERGLTLVQVAQDCDLSHPFLSQIERGLARPSMASLYRIAQTLGTTQHALLAASAASTGEGAAIRRRTEEAPAESGGAAVHALVDGERPFVPLEFVGASTALGETWVHADDEFVYVVAGRLVIEIAGEHATLEAYDSAYVPGGTAHRWASADGEPYRLLVVKNGLGHAAGADS